MAETYGQSDVNQSSGPPEARVAETSHVTKLAEQIESARKRDEDRHKELGRFRKYLRGKMHGDDAGGLVRTNLIMVNQNTIIPHIYAKNPEIMVTPTEAVDSTSYEYIKGFCKTLEIVLQRMFVIEGQLKKRMKSNLRSVFATGEGWLKLVYLRDYDEDPLMLQKLNDIQDNIQKIQHTLQEMERDDRDYNTTEAQKFELEQLMAGIEKQVEVVVAEGLFIDRILTEDVLILDETIKDFDYYVEASKIAQRIWYTKEDYEEQFGYIDDKDSPTYYKKPTRNESESAEGTSKPGAKSEQYVEVFEVWDKGTNTVYTICTGRKTYCRSPYQPEKLGERWYPFFRQGWNLTDGDINPVADVSQQIELQDEYNTTRTHLRQHREDSVPVRIVRKGGQLTEEDVKAIQKRKVGDIIPVEGNPQVPLDQDLFEFRNIPLDPQLYDTSPIRADMELVAGRGDAAAGTVQQAKTATEAEILREGLMSRSSERQDINEDLIQEMACYAAEVLLQEISFPMVQRIAGQGAIWPKLPKQEIFNLVQIEIRAGSMGKPNKQRDRDQWIQLYPILKNGIIEIFNLRVQGNLPLAEALSKLMKETLVRFDERLDLEEFIGPSTSDPNDMVMQMLRMVMGQGGMPAGAPGMPGQLPGPSNGQGAPSPDGGAGPENPTPGPVAALNTIQ